MDSRKIPVYNYFKTMTIKKVKMKSHGKYLHKFITLILKKISAKLKKDSLDLVFEAAFNKRKYEPFIYFTRRIFAKYDGPKFALEDGNTTWPYLSKKNKRNTCM